MKAKFIFLIFACFLFSLVNAQESPLLFKSAVVEFDIKNAGFTVNGTVSGISAVIFWSEASLENVNIQATASVKTLETGLKARDRHLMKEEYFYEQAFPEMKLQSKKIRKISTGKYEGSFDLQIKGTTKQLVIPFTMEKGIFTGKFTLNRLDFKIGESSWILSDEVNIVFKVICQTP